MSAVNHGNDSEEDSTISTDSYGDIVNKSLDEIIGRGGDIYDFEEHLLDFLIELEGDLRAIHNETIDNYLS